jgi:hypothetical protein
MKNRVYIVETLNHGEWHAISWTAAPDSKLAQYNYINQSRRDWIPERNRVTAYEPVEDKR